MLSLDDRKKLIEYLDKNKDELKDIQQDIKLAKEELKTKPIQEVLTKKRLGEILHILILFMRFIKSISENFEEE